MYGYRGPRRKLTAEETAANAARKVEREAATMTCQCCGRKHLANRGWIAHHGYQRPGHGWQTASCMGAKHVPFEVDRAQLGKMIEALKDYHRRCLVQLGEVMNETRSIELSYTYNTGRYGYKADRKTVTFSVNRANWKTAKVEHPKYFEGHYGSRDHFDQVKVIDVANRENEIKNVTRDIDDQTKRYNGWKQTHRWNEQKEKWEQEGVDYR